MAVAALSPLYLKLIRKFPLRPIRSEEELDRAIAVVDSLVVRMDERTPEEQDYLEILSDIVEKYESEIYPEPVVPPHVMLRELIAFRGATRAEVARATGIGESVLSELLRGKRTMGRKTIETLVRYFKVDPGLSFAPEGETSRGTKRGRGGAWLMNRRRALHIPMRTVAIEPGTLAHTPRSPFAVTGRQQTARPPLTTPRPQCPKGFARWNPRPASRPSPRLGRAASRGRVAESLPAGAEFWTGVRV